MPQHPSLPPPLLQKRWPHGSSRPTSRSSNSTDKGRAHNRHSSELRAVQMPVHCAPHCSSQRRTAAGSCATSPETWRHLRFLTFFYCAARFFSLGLVDDLCRFRLRRETTASTVASRDGVGDSTDDPDEDKEQSADSSSLMGASNRASRVANDPRRAGAYGAVAQILTA